MTDTMTAPALARCALPEAGRETAFSLSVRMLDGFNQVTDFRLPGVALLGLDECPPLGHGWGPSPAHLLGSAIGGCLGASLLQRLRDDEVDVVDLHTEVRGTIRRDEQGRLRIGSISVRLSPLLAAGKQPIAAITPAMLAEYAAVTESVREGIDVKVTIAPEVLALAGR